MDLEFLGMYVLPYSNCLRPLSSKRRGGVLKGSRRVVFGGKSRITD